ncbi:MAG: protein-S-isoprenylcysteine O-methyltransferase Ste14 [Candidatus Paceibacteria bacterium]|jgi:protein-S-isoprenylcysteine O-methyltransferase Ste14
MQTLLFMIIIILTWIFIWLDLARCANPNPKSLPENKRVKVAGIILLISITCFYTTLYSGLSFIFIAPWYVQFVCVGLLLGGAHLVVGARKQMSTLTAKEVLFSINTSYSAAGVFQKFTHPMFFGIGIILISSWCLLPNILPAVFLLTSLVLLCVKAGFESSELKKRLSLRELGTG